MRGSAISRLVRTIEMIALSYTCPDMCTGTLRALLRGALHVGLACALVLASAGTARASEPLVLPCIGPAPEVHEPCEENPPGRALDLLGTRVEPGTFERLAWSAPQTFDGIAVPTPVLVVNGSRPGPVLCLTAAVHGDELNGIEIVRRVLHGIVPEGLAGTLIGVPIVNLQGFRRSSRYLPDRRDLNRYFPGNPLGSSASRIADAFFRDIVVHCDGLIDLHTGSFHRSNLPHLRADLGVAEVADLARSFGATVVLHNEGAEGTLRRAAVDAGIPAVTLEAGEPMRLQEDQVEHGVFGIRALLDRMGMYEKRGFHREPEPVYFQSKWIRADHGGILLGEVELGDRVERGMLLGTVTDPITNRRSEIVSPFDGRVLGMALNQVVMPGFAAYRIGIATASGALDDPAALPTETPTLPEPEDSDSE